MLKKILTILLAILAVPCLLLAQETAKSGARLYIEDTSFDFGYIAAGSVVSHSYVFHSRGTDSLKILNVKPGCGCTKAPLKKEVVAAGDSTEVELVFTSNKGAKGNVGKSATVTCNDPDRGTFQLSFKGRNFTDPDSLTPLTLSEGELAINGQSHSREVKLVVRNVSDSAIKMHLVSQPEGYLKVEVPNSAIQPGKEKEIMVKIDSSFSEDQFKKSFTFAVDDQSGSRYTIPVSYSKTAEVSVIQSASSKTKADSK